MKTKPKMMAPLVVLLLFGTLSHALAFYNPQTGHWLSRDPIGERGGDNPYNFVWNRPITVIDVFGREPKDESIVVTIPSIIPASDTPMSGVETWVDAKKDSYHWTVIHVDDISDGNKKLKDTPCKCIKTLNILGHGNEGYQSVGNGDNALKVNNNTKTVSGMGLFSGLKSKFCKPCQVYLRGCMAGKGDAGRALLKAIANATGCTANGWVGITTEITPYQGLPATGLPLLGVFNGPATIVEPDAP